MYNNLQSNPFQRQTDLLEQPEIREEIMMIYLASAAIAQANWVQALSQISKYRQMVRHSRLEEQQALELELQFMQTFCTFKMGDLAKTEQMIENMLVSILQNVAQLSHNRSQNRSVSSQNASLANITQKQFSYKSFAVKVYTLAASLIISQENTNLDFKEIKKGLLQLLDSEEMRQFIPQVLGTLTGCKCFRPVIELKHLEGGEDTKKAKKMQILADWKFMAGLAEEAVALKQKAASLWQALNRHKQLLQCKKQLQELMKGNTKSQYKLRLARIKVFAEPIIKLEPALDGNRQKKQTLPLIKLHFPQLLDSLRVESEAKMPPKQPMLSQSKKTKQNLLEKITSQCEAFYQSYKEEIGGETTNLLLNSKFVDEQFKKVRKCMSIFPKLRAMRLREGFSRLNKLLGSNNALKQAVISKFKASDLN